MAAVLDEAEVEKAVTAGAPADMVHFSFPIQKSEDTEDVNPVDGTPDLVIWGKVTDGTLDSDLQIVDPKASLRWIKTWYDTKANIRLGHDPKRPIGRGLEIDGHYVKALIAEPTAKHLIRSKVLNDWSVGIMNPDIRKGDPQFQYLDPTGKAVNGVITDRSDGLTALGEISAVDRGSNYGTSFQLVKAAAGGGLEWVGKMAGEPAVTKDAAPKAWKSVSVDLPASMRIKVSPADLAKMNTLAARNAAPAVTKADLSGEPGPEVVRMTGGEPVIKADLKDSEREGMPASDFAYVDAEGGKHLPVHDEGHVRSALGRFAQQHFGSPAAKRKAARKIVSRARSMGIDLGEHGTVVSAAGGKTKVAKSAAPEAVKCAKCGGTGMTGRDDAVPCPDCTRGKSAGPGAMKKKKVMCPTCGAKQNVKHQHCPECGNPLHPAIPIMKNHDFDCLHCGHEDLDKGEQFCPGCGNANPGYLQVADRKLPMNAEAGKSAGKDRVPDSIAKRGKASKGKKKKDGKKKELPPFLQPDDGDDKDGAAKKAAAVTKKRKGGKKGGKGRSPAVGAVSQTTEGLPPHREPDGAPVEAFEADTSLSDGDHEMKAAQRHRSLGIDAHLAVLHDLTCPAFSPKSVAVCLPNDSLAAIDTEYWQGEALKAASSAGFPAALDEYNRYAALSRDAATLKTADPQLLLDIAGESHKGFLEANADLLKTFMDATPGPGSFPSPSHPMPQQFRRPFVSAGHAATSPQHDAPHSFAVTEGSPVARDFDHGYLTAGHATDSPYNSTPRPMPTPAPMSAGNPDSMHFTNVQRANAEQARGAMHDHVSRLFPDVCPMSPEMGATQKPGRPVQPPVGAPIPHAAGKAAKPGKTKAEKKADAARKAAKMAARKAEKARKAAKAEVRKAAKAAELPAVTQKLEVDASGLSAAIDAATGPLMAKLDKAASTLRQQRKAIRAQAKVLDAIAGQPDTSAAPFRGAGVAKTVQTSAALAGPRTASESAEQAQTNKMRRLWDTWRHTSNPEFQEAAWQELQAMLGTEPLTGYDTGLTPMRRNPMT